jgi:hypothetical protein
MSSRGIHLREISDLLRSWDGDRHLLIGADHEYWTAALDADARNEPFEAWHARICGLIFGEGGIRATIEAMDEETARLTAVELARFSEEGRRELPREFIRHTGGPRLAVSIPAQWQTQL